MFTRGVRDLFPSQVFSFVLLLLCFKLLYTLHNPQRANGILVKYAQFQQLPYQEPSTMRTRTQRLWTSNYTKKRKHMDIYLPATLKVKQWTATIQRRKKEKNTDIYSPATLKVKQWTSNYTKKQKYKNSYSPATLKVKRAQEFVLATFHSYMCLNKRYITNASCVQIIIRKQKNVTIRNECMKWKFAFCVTRIPHKKRQLVNST